MGPGLEALGVLRVARVPDAARILELAPVLVAPGLEVASSCTAISPLEVPRECATQVSRKHVQLSQTQLAERS